MSVLLLRTLRGMSTLRCGTGKVTTMTMSMYTAMCQVSSSFPSLPPPTPAAPIQTPRASLSTQPASSPPMSPQPASPEPPESAPSSPETSTETEGRSTTASGSVVYEGERAVSEYLQFHYGREEEVLPYPYLGAQDALDFPARCARLCIDAATFRAEGDPPLPLKDQRALDIGCAVGGASFALAKQFGQVVGIDYSQAFVDAANIMRTEGRKSYRYLIEGDEYAERVAVVPTGVKTSRLEFLKGDACDLDIEALGQFDAVLASNLLCRLPKPRAFLKALIDIVKPGGIAAIISPYSWLEEYTPRSEWLTLPKKRRNSSINTTRQEGGSFEALRAIMEAEGQFVLESRGPMPFLIREHARKFQYGVSDATIWRRQRKKAEV